MAPSVSARQLAPVVNPDLVVDDANSDRVAADLLDVQAVMGLEPDPVAIDDAHDRDRDLEDRRGQMRDAFERSVGRGVEDVVAPDRRQPPLLLSERVPQRVRDRRGAVTIRARRPSMRDAPRGSATAGQRPWCS
jgi:hypothetical protein